MTFELKSINFNFTFTGKELFYIENKKKYFKILFVFSNSQSYWYLGREFLKKYRLRFNPDKKLIYIPLGNNENETKTENNQISDNKSIYKQVYIWIILTFAIVIIGLVLFIIFYLKKYPRKKRANELIDDEDYDYTQKDNLDQNIN